MAKSSSRQQSRREHPQIVLIGQPNCGKSTIYNSVAGYRSIATNFPGATVEYTTSHVSVNGRTSDLVDLPGIYSLISIDRASEESKKFLIEQNSDVIINVVDASILSRSLELTLQLLELDKPMVLCLNMMDEAQRKGIRIDVDMLSEILQIPVVTTIGSKGQGIDELFDTAFQTLKSGNRGKSLPMSRHVEEKIQHLENVLSNHPNLTPNWNHRLLAIKLVEEDPYFIEQIELGGILGRELKTVQQQLEAEHDQSADQVISSERHSKTMDLFERVATVKTPKQQWVDRIDDVLMHPIWGYVFMAGILLGFFNIIFSIGAYLEEPLLQWLDTGIASMLTGLPEDGVPYQTLFGALQGIAGGIGIVLPYLLPFLLGMALLEDIGYLPRIAFLMDSFMHRIGLHGTAVIPGLLGYGCSVPAVMATRILNSPRDRFIATVIAVLIPCSARMTIIMGLVGYYLGGTAAFGIYIFNLIVISIIGSIMSRLLPEDIPGMILEMPSYHKPKINVLFAKTWLRMRDFIVIAWPLLIAGSLVMGLADYLQWDAVINTALRPITYILDLPNEVGTTLIFGILRKELSMLMLFQALGTSNVTAVMSHTQILVFTLFVVFYIPCLATIGIMGKEIGWKRTLLASAVTLVIAIVVALLGRVFGMVVF